MRRRHGENYFASCFCIVAICLIVHKHTTLWQLTPCNNQFILLLQLDSERSSPPKLIWPTSAWESESSTVLLVCQLFFSKNTSKVTDYAIILQKWHNKKNSLSFSFPRRLWFLIWNRPCSLHCLPQVSWIVLQWGIIPLRVPVGAKMHKILGFRIFLLTCL